MICPKCKTRNPIGNKFCRECGEKLVLPEGSLAAEEAARVSAERETEKYAALLMEAHALSDAKNFDAALPIAEEAAQILPESTSAHSLLATLYERTDQEQKAIAAMEKVVALNPESEADKIKLNQLKRGVHVLPRQTPLPTDTRIRENSPLPWLPLALAGGTAVLVLGGGLFFLFRPHSDNVVSPPFPPRPAVVSPPVSAANPSGVAPQYVAPTPLYSSTTVAAPPPPPAQVRTDPFASIGPKPSPSARAARAVTTPTRRVPTPAPVAPVTVAPPPSGSGGAAIAPLPPISAAPPTSGQTGGNGDAAGGFPGAPGFGTGGRLPVGPPPQQPGGPTSGGAAPASNGTGNGASNNNGSSGYIHISVGGKTGSGSGGGSSNNGGSTGSPLSRARALQQAGQYNDAIAAYRQAVASGSSSGSAYQGMAQCYENLNEPGGARSAYRDAIRAYGASRSDSAQRGIASCKAALEVLGGG